jgi:hypothetical protein
MKYKGSKALKWCGRDALKIKILLPKAASRTAVSKVFQRYVVTCSFNLPHAMAYIGVDNGVG